MILTILLALLSPVVSAPVKPASLATVRPCVWPNRCGAAARTEALAQFKPCVFPNTCGAQPSLING